MLLSRSAAFEVCLIALLTLLWSCHSKDKKAEDAAIISLEIDWQKADSSWKKMISSDDGKIENINRLISELLLLDGCDSALLLQCREKSTQMASGRYNKGNIREPGRIEKFDSLSIHIINSLQKETNRIPGATDFQLINQLLNEIKAADDSVIFYRKDYDHHVDTLNQNIRKNKKILEVLGDSSTKFRTYPVFRLIP